MKKPRILLIPRRDDYENYVIDMGSVFKVAGECPHFDTLHVLMASEWYLHPETKALGPYYKCLRCEARGGSGIHYEYGDKPSCHRIPPEPLFDELMEGSGVKCAADYKGPRTRVFLGYLCPPCGEDQRRENRMAHIPQGKKVGVK